ncbi:MAG TPA: YggT family protein [Verrucomicrobiota bacterium]|nr:hypothetical protein [Verrucomicrobiales bacterium]HRI11443.1 YggT family protein [Verrucomicrobiota bacterium]
MPVINFLFDLAALVLGLSVLGVGARPPVQRAGTLLGNLKPADQRATARWKPLAILVALLVLRPLLYAPLAEITGTIPEWSPTPASVPFRPDYFSRLLTFSLVSFSWTTLIFLFWVLLLSTLVRGCREPGPWNRFFQETLGPLARWPVVVALFLPPLVGGCWWYLGRWPLAWLGVLPAAPTPELLIRQSLLIAAGIWVSARWLFAGLLVLRLVNTYVYLGTHPFWDFVHQVGGVLLRPLRWLPLQLGKLDFAPLIAAVLILAAGWGAERGLVELYLRLRS